MKTYLKIITVCLLVSNLCQAETITLATYNIERFGDKFDVSEIRKWATTQPNVEELKQLIAQEKKQDDEDSWEVAEVFRDRRFNPDICVIEECCTEADLKHFNKRWLRGTYETVIVFPSNSERVQYLGLLMKPGFKIIEKRDQYYLEPDPVGNDRGDRLFARGPAFVLVESPRGYQFWVGVTHQKSKSGNSPRVTAWRNREAVRTHQIIKEIEKSGSGDVILLGDMNDEWGEQEFEKENGGDSIANLVGPESDGLFLATGALIKAGKISYGGYWVPTYRSFIDHIIVTPSLKPQIESVEVFTGGLTRSASDHYPVTIRIRSKGAAADLPNVESPTTTRDPAHDAGGIQE